MNKSNPPLFVYGTLSFPAIISALLGRQVNGQPASIDGYLRIRVKDKRYPGLIAGEGQVEGALHSDLSADELALLDTFEDDFYERIRVPVTAGDKQVVADVYIIPKTNLAFATDEIWDRNGFGRQHIDDYLQMVSRYRRDYLAGASGSQQF